ncbi:hypothetical protein [Thioalkalivibrio sp. ALE19]|uniref:hypothetical protein n=1 Tax=Thioalkalivibrio sp. ALE19 TaxID=1266909 RepID=UPI0012DE27BD|nr:hypothetical protein [Thioalkalivibrio sp. ALE19]
MLLTAVFTATWYSGIVDWPHFVVPVLIVAFFAFLAIQGDWSSTMIWMIIATLVALILISQQEHERLSTLLEESDNPSETHKEANVAAVYLGGTFVISMFGYWLGYRYASSREHKSFHEPRENIKKELMKLRPICPETHPDECLVYLCLTNQDKVLESYQRKIAHQGRRPLVVEYKVARKRVWGEEGTEERRQKAESACRQMGAVS